MFNDISKTINDVAVIVLTTVGASGLLALLSYLRAHTKNVHLQQAYDFARQAVLMAETISGDGLAQKGMAEADLNKRLADNGLAKYFKANQVSSIVQTAWATAKQSGLIDVAANGQLPQGGGPIKPVDAKQDASTKLDPTQGDTVTAPTGTTETPAGTAAPLTGANPTTQEA